MKREEVLRMLDIEEATLRQFELFGLMSYPCQTNQWYSCKDIAHMQRIISLCAKGLSLMAISHYFLLEEEGDITISRRKRMLLKASQKLAVPGIS